MHEHDEDLSATVPAQRETAAPVRKSMPVVIALVVIVALIGIANVSSLMSGNANSRSRPPCSSSKLPRTRPALNLPVLRR